MPRTRTVCPEVGFEHIAKEGFQNWTSLFIFEYQHLAKCMPHSRHLANLKHSELELRQTRGREKQDDMGGGWSTVEMKK